MEEQKGTRESLKKATVFKPTSLANDENTKQAFDRVEDKSAELKLHSKSSTIPGRNQRENKEKAKQACECKEEPKSTELKQRTKMTSTAKELNPMEIV